EADQVADRRLPGDRVDALVVLQLGIVLTQGGEGGVGDLLGGGGVLAEANHEEGGAGALDGHGPAGVALLAFEDPVLGVAEADASVAEFGHRSPPCVRGLRVSPSFYPGPVRRDKPPVRRAVDEMSTRKASAGTA